MTDVDRAANAAKDFEPGEQSSTMCVICPYCGHQHDALWPDHDSDDIACACCGKYFACRTIYDIVRWETSPKEGS